MKNTTAQDWVNWAFMGMLSFMAYKTVESIDNLNIEVAKVVAVVGQHEKRIDKLEDMQR